MTDGKQGDDPTHAFDFWVGSWIVTDAATGERVGHNRIEAVVGGRALHEHWTGVSGLKGESLNIYDEQRGRWHQTWVSSNGMLLELDGGIRDGAMEMQGSAGDKALHRIRWTPMPDGTVVQRWEQSGDEGASWELLFEGIYKRE
ncbi:MAG TPA: hypothetical protein VN618_13715 [Solirubrobacteraceae bacterium]|nr:hypothetical protein [Solirubrobacteraceae bacterium]